MTMQDQLDPNRNLLGTWYSRLYLFQVHAIPLDNFRIGCLKPDPFPKKIYRQNNLGIGCRRSGPCWKKIYRQNSLGIGCRR